MSQPRRLTFAVSTSLLTASLAVGVAGCNKNKTVNVHPDEVHANPGPEDGGEVEEPEPSVNEGPVTDEADADVDVDADAEAEATPDADAEAAPE